MSTFGFTSPSSAECDPTNNAIRQKLMVMESAVAQVTSVKNQLKINAEIARKEISNAIGHQLSLVRAREQLLLNFLENVVESKERVLCEQQEQLNQAIGACQQSLECTIRGPNDANSNMLFRISALDLRPRTNSHLVFQCDPSDMRRAMCNFGQVISDPSIKDRSDCLALEAEEYEDNVNLAHKSVLRMHRGNSPLASDPLPPSISEWLYQARRNSCNEGLEIPRNRLYSTNSSIEVISKSEYDGDSNAIEALRLPMDQWLRKTNPNKFSSTVSEPQEVFPGLKRGSTNSEQIIEQTLQYLNDQFSQTGSEPTQTTFIKSFSDLDVATPRSETPRQKSFEFESVINSIKESETSDWLASSKKIKGDSDESVKAILTSLPPSNSTNFGTETEKCIKTETTAPSFSTSNSCSKECLEEKINKLLPKVTQEMSYWLKEYPTKASNRPVNEVSEDLTPWERVLGWKGILEKLHSSSDDEWLVPASRQIKTEQS
uniref:Uncharacterized protein n=1 Tax=Panagrolaimus sp. PS1159 TaxID=55785 RepID=A0AC35EQZ6_9BILA